MRLSIVVPCFNEAPSAAKVAAELLPVAMALAETHQVQLVFVDDGSTDDTRLRFSDLAAMATSDGIRAVVLSHAENRGLGAALRTGFSGADGDVLLTTDADGTYSFDELPAILARLDDDVDIVTASPYHPCGAVANVPCHRLALSRGSSWVYRQLVSSSLHTYTSLFRAYRRRVVDCVPFESDGFLAGTEILVNAIMAGYRVTEHPTVLRARLHGCSNLRLARTTFAHLRFQARVLASRLHLRHAPWATGGRTGQPAIGDRRLRGPSSSKVGR